MLINILYIFDISKVISYRTFAFNTLERLVQSQSDMSVGEGLYLNEEKFIDILYLLKSMIYDIQYIAYKIIRNNKRINANLHILNEHISEIQKIYEITNDSKILKEIPDIKEKLSIQNNEFKKLEKTELERINKDFFIDEYIFYYKYDYKIPNIDHLKNEINYRLNEVLSRINKKMLLCDYLYEISKNNSFKKYKADNKLCRNLFIPSFEEIKDAIIYQRNIEEKRLLKLIENDRKSKKNIEIKEKEILITEKNKKQKIFILSLYYYAKRLRRHRVDSENQNSIDYFFNDIFKKIKFDYKLGHPYTILNISNSLCKKLKYTEKNFCLEWVLMCHDITFENIKFIQNFA